MTNIANDDALIKNLKVVFYKIFCTSRRIYLLSLSEAVPRLTNGMGAAHQTDTACLRAHRTFIGGQCVKDLVTNLQLLDRLAVDDLPSKIHIQMNGGFDEAIALIRVELDNPGIGGAVMKFDVMPGYSEMLFELALSDIEGCANDLEQVTLGFVASLLSLHHNLFLRKADLQGNLNKALTCLTLRRFEGDTAGYNLIRMPFQMIDPVPHPHFHGLGSIHIVEDNIEGHLHRTAPSLQNTA